MENPPENSKSLVLITRVGSTPTTGIKRNSPSLSGGVFFLSAACARVEQHGPALQGERSALRAVAQCAGDPHHRHKKAPPACLGELSFYLRRMSGSNSTARISDKEHHGLGVHIKTEKQKLPRKNTVRQLLLFICRVPPRVPTVPFHLIPLPQRGVFARCICGCSAARLFREGLSVLPKRRTLARKKRRNAVPTIYSAVSYRFYNVFYKKDFTNEF